MRIGILSDTHGILNPRVMEFLNPVDEIWHAGDIGNIQLAEYLEARKTLRAVVGNIDGSDLRSKYPEQLEYKTEGVKVLIRHVGGYPGRYSALAGRMIKSEKPGLFVCGHSHILRVQYDKNNNLLFINPGAAGNFGFHKSITAVRLIIEGVDMKNLEVLDISR